MATQVKFAVYISNQGDGSCLPQFFRNEEEAELAAERDDERYCEDVGTYTLSFDDDGNLLLDSRGVTYLLNSGKTLEDAGAVELDRCSTCNQRIIRCADGEEVILSQYSGGSYTTYQHPGMCDYFSKKEKKKA